MITWLADVLRAAGVPVAEYPGWRTRTASGSFNPVGVIWHHDASMPGPSPALARVIAEVGNASTPPPLSQAWVDMAGVWHVIAAGRANHAGTGSGWGRIRGNQGNTDAIGVETDHTVNEPWPGPQLASLRVGTRAILARLGASPGNALCGHKEYAPGRKIDPDGLDMNLERRLVAEATTSGTDTIMSYLDQTSPGETLDNGYHLADKVDGLLANTPETGAGVPNGLSVTLTDLKARLTRIETLLTDLAGAGLVFKASGEIVIKADPA